MNQRPSLGIIKAHTYTLSNEEANEITGFLNHLSESCPDEFHGWEYKNGTLKVTATPDGFMRLDVELQRWRHGQIRAHLRHLNPMRLELVIGEAQTRLKELED